MPHRNNKLTSETSGTLSHLIRPCVCLLRADGPSLQARRAGAVLGAAAQHLSMDQAYIDFKGLTCSTMPPLLP